MPVESGGSRVRVCVVSDVRFYREGLGEVLAATAGITVTGTGDASEEAVRAAAALDPDVVLLDTTMVDGVAAAQRIARELPRTKIVALGIPESDDELIVLVEAGVLGYVTRENSLDEVVAAIGNVVREQVVGSPKLRTLLVKRVRALAAELRSPADVVLTTRERQIVDLIAQGLTNKAIANELRIEPATVKNHVHNILHKLGVNTRAAAVAEVRRVGRRASVVATAQPGRAA